MAFARWTQIGFAAFVLTSALLAQQPTGSLRFDVVSIRAVPRDAPHVNRDQDFTPVLPGNTSTKGGTRDEGDEGDR
jgi:hypothetical protein